MSSKLARFSGSFTSANPAVRHEVLLPQGQPDYFMIRNRTAWGDDAAETSVQAEWFRGMAQDSALTMDQAVTSGALSSEAITANGLRFYDTANPPVYAALATTAITAADPAVVTMADTGSISVGDVVRLSGTTGMLQVASYDFSVNAVSANSSITLNLDASNFAAAATAGSVKLFIPNRFYPRRRFIVDLNSNLGITQAVNAVVSTSVAHDFTVGEKVRLKVPSQFGMLEANDKLATVLSVTTYTVTLDLDTSGFTAFAMPTSAVFAAGGQIPAQIVPAGAGPEDGANPPGVPVDAAYDNRNKFIASVGANIITSATAVYDWVAEYSDQHFAE